MIVFRLAESRQDYGWCVAIRTLVFAVEQHVDLALDVDAHEDGCRHFIGLDEGRPFATARWRVYAPAVAKVERVAVLKEWRGQGHGAALMAAVMADIRAVAPQCTTIRLGSQDEAIPFYEKLGFIVAGEGYMDAGIAHHRMERGIA